MRGIIGRVWVLVVLLAALPAAAAPRLVVGPVRGDAKRAIPRQLDRALCSTYECVPWTKVSRKGKLDLSLVRKQGAAGVLLGSISKRAGKVLTLDLFTRSAKPSRSWRLPLTSRGLLDNDSLDLVQRELGTRFGVEAPPPALPSAPPQAARPAPPVPLPPPPDSRPQADTWREAPAPAASAPPAYTPVPPPPAAREPEAPPEEPVTAQWFVAAEAGGYFAKRDLTFSGSAAGPLLEHHAPGMGGLAVRGELFPIAFTKGAFRGLGLSVDYARSLSLKTEDSSGTKHPTTATRLGAALLWRSPGLSSLQIVLVPSVGYEFRQLIVSPIIAGLPNAQLAGLRGGLGLEVPLGSRFTLLAGAAYVHWLVARELIKGAPAFFPGGSAFGIDAEAGLAVRIWGPLSIRALGGYTFTSYSFKADRTGTYSASGATDTTLGGRGVLRFEY